MYELPRSSSNLLSAFVAAGGLNDDASMNIEVRSPAQRPMSSVGGRENRMASYSVDPAASSPAVSRSVRINLISASQAGRGINLRDGDVVMVHERDQNPIQVLGLVRKPGEYTLPTDRELRVLDAIALSGGVRSPVANKIYVIAAYPMNRRLKLLKSASVQQNVSIWKISDLHRAMS